MLFVFFCLSPFRSSRFPPSSALSSNSLSQTNNNKLSGSAGWPAHTPEETESHSSTPTDNPLCTASLPLLEQCSHLQQSGHQCCAEEGWRERQIWKQTAGSSVPRMRERTQAMKHTQKTEFEQNLRPAVQLLDKWGVTHKHKVGLKDSSSLCPQPLLTASTIKDKLRGLSRRMHYRAALHRYSHKPDFC